MSDFQRNVHQIWKLLAHWPSVPHPGPHFSPLVGHQPIAAVRIIDTVRFLCECGSHRDVLNSSLDKYIPGWLLKSL